MSNMYVKESSEQSVAFETPQKVAPWVFKHILANLPRFDGNKCYVHDGKDQGYYYINDLCGIKTISPKDASELIEFHNLMNRTHEVSYSIDLGQRMCHGVDIAIVVIEETGEILVVNGQHTLGAIVEKGETVESNVRVYYARNMEGYYRIFQLTDDNKRRTVAQNTKMGIQSGYMIDRNPSLLRTALSGYLLAENGFSNNNTPKTVQGKVECVKTEDFQEFLDHLEPFTQFFVNKGKTKLVPVGVVASFRAMLKGSPEEGTEFITKYMNGSNLQDNDPILALRNRILTTSKTTGHARIESQIGLCYSAWKCFIEGRECGTLRQTSNFPDIEGWNPMFIRAKAR